MKTNIHRMILGAALAIALLIASPLYAEEEHDDHNETAHAESGDGQGEDHSEHDSEAEAIKLGSETVAEFGMSFDIAGPGVVVRAVVLPAEVRPNQDRLAHIAPRFPGIAREVRKRVGDTVKAGETLAIIESSESLAPYELKTEIPGIVIERHITRGEPVSQERGRVFTIADLRSVWIDISVYQKHLPYVDLGQPVTISAGHGRSSAQSTIIYVSPVVDEDTRTATARIELPNPNGIWRPGLFVTATVEVERSDVAIAIPRSAIEIVDGVAVVFVEDKDGFEPRSVVLGRQGQKMVEVTEGLRPGERYVSSGGFTLKSELAREELSGGHSH